MVKAHDVSSRTAVEDSQNVGRVNLEGKLTFVTFHAFSPTLQAAFLDSRIQVFSIIIMILIP
jgi:hypothetical protein